MPRERGCGARRSVAHWESETGLCGGSFVKLAAAIARATPLGRYQISHHDDTEGAKRREGKRRSATMIPDAIERRLHGMQFSHSNTQMDADEMKECL